MQARLLNYGRSAAHIFVRYVSARADRSNADVAGPAFALDKICESTYRSRKVRRDGAVDVCLQSAEFDFDKPVVLGLSAIVGTQTLYCPLLCFVGDRFSIGSHEKVVHLRGERKGRSCSTNPCINIADSSYAGIAESSDSRSKDCNITVGAVQSWLATRSGRRLRYNVPRSRFRPYESSRREHGIFSTHVNGRCKY